MTKDERIQELEDRVAVLEEALGMHLRAPSKWGLAPIEKKVLGLIVKHPEGASTERIYTALYGDRADPPQGNVIRVTVSNMRRKLRPYGIRIENQWGDGYLLPPESRAIVRTA